jgi:hypothetical protein
VCVVKPRQCTRIFDWDQPIPPEAIIELKHSGPTRSLCQRGDPRAPCLCDVSAVNVLQVMLLACLVAEGFSGAVLELTIGARCARLQVRRARKRADGARLTRAIRSAGRCGHDLGTRSACRVLQTERPARFALKLRVAARSALGGVTGVRVLPRQAREAALWRVQVAVGLVLPGRACDLRVAVWLTGGSLVLAARARSADQTRIRELVREAVRAVAARRRSAAELDARPGRARGKIDAVGLAALVLELASRADCAMYCILRIRELASRALLAVIGIQKCAWPAG